MSRGSAVANSQNPFVSPAADVCFQASLQSLRFLQNGRKILPEVFYCPETDNAISITISSMKFNVIASAANFLENSGYTSGS